MDGRETFGKRANDAAEELTVDLKAFCGSKAGKNVGAAKRNGYKYRYHRGSY